jgi:hypothetical protein
MILIWAGDFLDKKNPKVYFIICVFLRDTDLSSSRLQTTHLSTKSFRDNSLIANSLTQILLVLLLTHQVPTGRFRPPKT